MPPTVESPEATIDASDTLERVTAALAAHNIEAIVVDTAEEAREQALALVPEGSEVHWAKSRTLDDLGLTEILGSDRYDAVRPKYLALDRRTQGRQIARIMAAPDYMLGSVQAITEAGELIVVSYAGSQIGPYAGAAGRVILIVGSQKIVPDIEAGLRRVREVAMPYEDARLREQLGVGTKMAKLLVIYEEPRPGRMAVVLVREPIGV
jgi:L-lactate utilization protein LutC